MNCRTGDGPAIGRPVFWGPFVIAPDRPFISCEEAGREIDFGGIGKGFALDKMKSLMIDWGIKAALLSAGDFFVCARGAQWRPLAPRATARHRRVLGSSVVRKG